MSRFIKLCGSISAFAALVSFASPDARAQTLSGVTVFSANNDGSSDGIDTWLTGTGASSLARLWVVKGTDINGPFLNGPAKTQAGLSAPLSSGTNTFFLFGTPGYNRAYFGMNLFFDGNGASPRISAFAPLKTAAANVLPFYTDNASSTKDLNFNNVSGAGAFSFADGPNKVILTEFFWASPGVNNLDRINGTTTSPDGAFDYIGKFTLQVAPLASASVTGTVILESCNDPEQNITVEFRPILSGTPLRFKQVLTPNGSDRGTFTLAGIPLGTYNIAIKGYSWLQKVIPNVTISGNVSVTPVMLLSADINNDNAIDSTDFGLLIGNYNSEGDP